MRLEQRMMECLRDIKQTGEGCFYFIEELRYGVATGLVALPDGILWKSGQRAALTPLGEIELEAV